MNLCSRTFVTKMCLLLKMFKIRVSKYYYGYGIMSHVMLPLLHLKEMFTDQYSLIHFDKLRKPENIKNQKIKYYLETNV